MLRNLRKKVSSARAGPSRRKPATPGSRLARSNRLTFEPLEPRLVLGADSLVISEFMAINHGTLADGLGRFEDWIEIYNPTATAVDLDGWYLTDKDDDLSRWPFPAYTLAPGDFLVVFASAQDVDDYVDPAGNLHTNFAIKGDGENVALVMPDGNTVVHAYWDYPQQVEDISYGLGGLDMVFEALVSSGAELSYHVPTPGEDVLQWTETGYDDSGWVDTVALRNPGLLITEVSSGETRFVEIQNVSDQTVPATDWRVLVNDASSGNINDVNPAAWTISGPVGAGQAYYRTDDPGDHYWGSQIAWDAEGPGWAMIIDDGGNVMDFVAWGYGAAEIAELQIEYGPFADITLGDHWSGPAAEVGTADPGPVTDGFVAFNDQAAGTGTHPNATTYGANGTVSGPLKDVATGGNTPVTLTTSENGVYFQTNGAAPALGTDAYNIFNGYVDFRSAAGSSLEIAGDDHYTHTFSGLDAGELVTYRFAGTAIRGKSDYDDRWTLVTLEGALSATPAHSSGVGVVVVSPSQAAIWTGHNSGSDQGFVAAWNEIDPGGDGMFSIVSTHYTGATPGVGSGTADGSKGYGIAGIRLEEVPPSGPLSWLVRTGGHDSDTAADFVRVRQDSKGMQNPELTVPFASAIAATTGIGFSDGQPDFQANIQTDVYFCVHDVGASLWSRIEFDAENPSQFDNLTLRMKYDDGFVAYLNGVEVARQNAPETLAYDSAATAEHPNEQAVVFEDIDLSDYLLSLQTGTNVLAIHGLNFDAGNDDFLILPELIATSNLGAGQFMITPTPGWENVEGALGFVKDTQFSVDRGFYDTPQLVEITTDTSGATIMYTLDGTKPTESNGTEYTGPVPISKTTTLRAFAFKPGYEPTNVDTHTYIFLGDVVRQDYQATLDAGFPSMWGSTSPDYGMDPDVIGTFDENGNPQGGDNYGGIYAATIRDDLKDVPTLSIVMDVDEMFGTGGIYTNSTQHGVAWERESSVELIYPDGVTEGFQVDCGIRIQGGAFRSHSLTKKHSLRLLFKEDYGPTKLRFPWFGPRADQSFDTIVLRAGANDGYAWSSARYTEQYTRDQFGRSLQRATGNAGSHGDFVHLYINGIYWGLYNPCERPDDSFSASYYGGDKDEWDAIHDGSASAGNKTAWNQMISKCQAAASSLAAYMELQGKDLDGTPNPAYPHLLDVPNYVDYLIVNVYGGNWDWPWKNWWAGRRRSADSTGFKFYCWDYENTMGNNLSRSPLDKNALNNDFSGAGEPHQSLKLNNEYRMLFADHVHRYLFNGGLLTPESLIPRYQELAAEVERAMVAESARWGDTHHSTPLTLEDWYDDDFNYNDGRAGRNWILNYYLPLRSGIVLDQFRGAGLYPAVTAPTFSQHGGQLAPGQTVTVTASSGTIYYTLDGTDPREIGGGINPGAVPTASGSTIPLSDSALVKTRVRYGSQWSALNEAVFLKNTPAGIDNLAITEINYHPYDPTDAELAIDPEFAAGDFEFIELKNIGEQRIDLYGAQLGDGITFDFDQYSLLSLDPDEYVVVARNPEAFAARYGTTGILLAGEYGGSLDDGGEQLALTDCFDQTLVDFDYDDSGSWPGRADGKGASLELIDPAAVPQTEPERTDYLEDGDKWHSSIAYGGTPGTEPEPHPGIVVNEVLTSTPAPDMLDVIELYNTTDASIDVGGWYLSDDWGWESNPNNGNYKKYRIEPDTQIPAHGYLLFDETHFNPNGDWNSEAGPRGPNEFALDGARGDDVWLMKADASGNLTHFGDHADFGAAASGASLGRWPNGQGGMYPTISPTLGGENNGPRLGSVIVSEVHYNPGELENAKELEFIEIYNTTGATVELTNWQIRKGIDFDFPAGATLAPFSAAVLVPFDLDEGDKLSDFLAAHEPEGPVQMFGGYSGQLSNAGEKVQLQRPGDPIWEPEFFIPHLLEDEVIYDDKGTWPSEPDGEGDSLHRLEPDSWGNDGTNWTSADPTPGMVLFKPAREVKDRRVFYNNSAFDGDNAAADEQDDDAIAADKTALQPGQTATFANYTSYSRGINGIMVDILNPANPDDLTRDNVAHYFEFRVGNTDDPDGWPEGPIPTGVSVRESPDNLYAKRVTITWDDYAIRNQWLQVTVLADPDYSGLDDPDVFYFGNAVGESGNSDLDAEVNETDLLLARDNPHNFFYPAVVTCPYDYNRDARVNATDMLIAGSNLADSETALKLIHPPALEGEGQEAGIGEQGTPIRDSSFVLRHFPRDAVFEQAGEPESPGRPTPLGKLTWLYEFERPSTRARPSRKAAAAEEAVDKLLASYWP